MARPLRIEFENGLYHVTARGNERRDIFRDEKDFSKLTELLQMYAERFGYCPSMCVDLNLAIRSSR